MRSQKSEVRSPLASGLRPLAPGSRSRVNAVSRHSSFVIPHSSGIALVITLVLLSVITFMTIAFLVLSRRDRGSVTTVTDANTAKYAADSAFERAKAEMIAPILAMTNDQQFDLLVSTNYINRNGFDPNAVDGRTNVNYDYTVSGAPLSQAQFQQNLTNLYYNPRPPVYVSTNARSPFNDFRFYLDLNRNSHFDTNGLLPVLTGIPGLPWLDTNGNPIATFNPPNILSNNFVGDPEWIGVLEFPDRPHGPNNRFVARYAYIVLPVGKMLDVNYMHNQAVTRALNTANDGYLRNQGVGTWELNLAAFLTDLNTNVWNPSLNPYLYRRAGGGLFNQGLAFEDSLALLAYRYNYNYQTLSSASALFPGGASLFVNDGIDEYSDGATMTNNVLNETFQVDQVGEKWAGSDNTNHYFTTQDFFDRSKIVPAINGFVDRLQNAGTSNDTYNAYTFYRMLGQLGTDSEVDNRININYRNVSNSVVVSGLETNLYAWTPLEFFTNAADAMFKQLNIRDMNGNLVTVTNIPLYPTNYYSASVHRVLQLAANIFDATTIQTVPLVAGQTNAFFPSVFRPIFRSQNGFVSIAGFAEVVDTTQLSAAYRDLPTEAANPGTWLGNIHGVPWVIGAKKGFPNFNEYAVNTGITFGRKLRLRKNSPGANPIIEVKQLYQVGISNTFAIEAWNSYAAKYPRNLSLIASNEISIGVSNQLGQNLIPSNWRTVYDFTTTPNPYPIAANTWDGYSQTFPKVTNFKTFTNGFVFFTNATYIEGSPARFDTNSAIFTSDATSPMPELYVTITNRLHYAVIDTTVVPNRVVDFVNVEGMIGPFNVSESVRHSTTCGNPGADQYAYWCTNQVKSPQVAYVPGIDLNQGDNYQIGVSQGVPALTDVQWRDAGADPNNKSQINSFRDFLNRNASNTNLMMQTPFNPAETTYIHTSWAANDPLVHYTIPDLADATLNTIDTTLPNPALPNIGKVNTRYRPWGGNPSKDDAATDRNLMLKDPTPVYPGKLKGTSDDWDFPTNRFPNIGWLGRVHRGTAWQTIYAKAVPGDSTNLTQWLQWSGHTNLWSSGVDARLTMPPNDYHLFDLFTAAPNANASRGRLGVNQTNLAAWSAVLSGVVVHTNILGTTNYTWTTIDPAGIYSITNPPPLVQIWTNINGTRANLYLSNGPVFAGGAFHSIGDVLAAPALTFQSPYLANVTNAVLSGGVNGVNDEILERIPQQIMSLLSLSHEPRFMVYSFGQTLHPAEHSLVAGGPFNGLCTNYQITAETATRALVRAQPFAVTNGNTISTNYNLVVEQYNVLPPD